MDSVKFHFPLQFYNRLIHQFWKNINTGISWLSTSSAEPAFSKPCPCRSASDHRCCEEEERGRQNRGWKEAREAQPARGPPHRGATSVPGELRQLTVPEDLPKYAYLKRKTHTQIIEKKIVSGINWSQHTTPAANSDQIRGTQAHCHLPSWRQPGQWRAIFFWFAKPFFFFFWSISPLIQVISLSYLSQTRQCPWPPSTRRPKLKTSPMLLLVVLFFLNMWSSVLKYGFIHTQQ